MTRTATRARTGTRSDSGRRDYVPALPHPSWRADTGAANDSTERKLTNASEFWNRLGL